MSQKPTIPKGTRDFSPEVMIKRNYIFDIIKEVYQLYGFLPIETPAMENLSSLMGKYGEEGDKLLFRTLNSGDFLSKVPEEEIRKDNALKLSGLICEKGLRYDLTVPFARYVVQNRNDITFPFRRYQIQPVWRADRPQKGRYREFFQCDADVIGSNSLVNEVELIQIIDEVFQKLNINVSIKINNRKILSGIAELIGEKDKIIDITVAIDKLDKIGLEKVNQELELKGISKKAIELLQPIINMQGSAGEKIALLKKNLQSIDIGLKGIEEIKFIMEQAEQLGLKNDIELDLTLARGLNYYTGAIIEVKAKDVAIGSICGGGRYDDLTGIFGLPDVSGVGISFGADRIFDVLEQLNGFPQDTMSSSKLIFVCFGEKELSYVLPLLKKVRAAGIKAEVYPDLVKLKKQMNYANNKNIPFVALVGEEEMNTGEITLKDMTTGEQDKLSIDEVIGKCLRS